MPTSQSHAQRITALVLFGALAAGAPAALAQDYAPPPSVRVVIEKIDPSSFPDVDVWYRVVDTVPGSEYHRLQPADVKVAEAPGGTGAFVEAKPVDDNLSQPKIQPLAMALAVDSSLSVTQILEKLRDSTVQFLQTMDDNGPLPDDAVSLVFFSGSNALEWVLRMPLTPDKATMTGFTMENLGKTGFGTPLHKAWNLAVADIAASDYPARGVLMLTDGQNFPPLEGPPVNSVIEAAVSNRIPIFNFGFTTPASGGQLARDSVYRPEMIRMSEITEGAYFEPTPPFPLAPDMPPAPDDTADPAKLDDAKAARYVRQTVGFLRNLLKKDPNLRFEQFAPLVNKLIDPDVNSLAELEARDLANDPSIDAIATKLSHDHLARIDQFVVASASQVAGAVDPEAEYLAQVSNMFTKVRASLKLLYRVTYRSQGEFRGEPRDVKVSVKYTTQENATPIELAGEAVGRYITPVIAEEDLPVEMTSNLNPASAVHQQLFGNVPAPRGGQWLGATQIAYRIDLMGPGAAGRPAVLASRTPEGEVSIADTPETAALSDDERASLAALLENPSLDASVDTVNGSLTVAVTASAPTCIRDPKEPWGRPVANPSVSGPRGLLWYRIEPRAVRPYGYILTVPTQAGMPGLEMPSQDFIKEEMPILVAFVTDTTAPSVGVYLTHAKGTARAEDVELPLDSAIRPRPQGLVMSGSAWSRDFDSALSASATDGTTAFPVSVVGLPVEGFFVEEDTRVKIDVLAKDNFDSTRHLRHLIAGSSERPEHVTFRDGEPGLPEAREGEAPYLSAWPPRAGQSTDPAAATDPTTVSVARVEAWLNKDGVREPLEDGAIFRRPNVPEGPPVTIEIRATDASGNVTSLDIPVKVLPVQLQFQRISMEWRKAD